MAKISTASCGPTSFDTDLSDLKQSFGVQQRRIDQLEKQLTSLESFVNNLALGGKNN